MDDVVFRQCHTEVITELHCLKTVPLCVFSFTFILDKRHQLSLFLIDMYLGNLQQEGL